MEEIIFESGSVPVVVAARVYGKDASWIRAGIISGWLPIGKATRNGKLVTKIITKPLDIGTLRIDTSDPDGPFMFLELSKDVDTVASEKYVVLKVNLENYISQK